MKTKKAQSGTILAFLLFFAALPLLPAQTIARDMDAVLESPAVTWAEAARFTLPAAGIAVTDADAAFQLAAERGWLPKNVRPEGTANFAGLSFLIMKAFNLRGGLLYSLFPGPRYAYRELTYKGILQGQQDPSWKVSGFYLINLIGRLDGGEVEATEQEERQQEEARQQQEEESRIAAEARQRFLQAERQRVAEEINVQLVAMNVEDTKAAASSEGVTISLSNINFQANSTQLERPEQRKIREIAEILKTIPGRKLLVVGHTALAGTREGQIQISTDRAQAVADYLVQLGARTAAEITVQGYGAERPVADNSTVEGLALNRRVEIVILEQP
jgi:outer membrane protein OmpA-like peptidoglycan-associated protein